MNEQLLEIENLEVSFATEDGLLRAVSGVSFSVSRGETVAIVGESGSGKSVTVMTPMGLTRSPNARVAGTGRLRGVVGRGRNPERPAAGTVLPACVLGRRAPAGDDRHAAFPVSRRADRGRAD